MFACVVTGAVVGLVVVGGRVVVAAVVGLAVVGAEVVAPVVAAFWVVAGVVAGGFVGDEAASPQATSKSVARPRVKLK